MCSTSCAIETDTQNVYLPDVVYTDGCCINNGRSGARAGIGVFWHDNSRFNISERLPGKQTNNRAEINAAIRALEQCLNIGKVAITLRTDSQFMINCITNWMPKWKRNGWRLVDGNPVKNKPDLERLDLLAQKLNVNWDYVPGHKGFYGNEIADQLAKNGANK